MYKIGQVLKAINNLPLEGNKVAPLLIVGETYVIEDIIEDKEDNQHLDVGILSEYEYIRSWETKEDLPNGDKIHWCHPSRFTAKIF